MSGLEPMIGHGPGRERPCSHDRVRVCNGRGIKSYPGIASAKAPRRRLSMIDFISDFLQNGIEAARPLSLADSTGSGKRFRHHHPGRAMRSIARFRCMIPT
jgi:hypothetical protein